MKINSREITTTDVPFAATGDMPSGSSAAATHRFVLDHNRLPAAPGPYQLQMSVLSDTHLLPRSQICDNAAFRSYIAFDSKLTVESEDILDAALEEVYRRQSTVLLLPGDLTSNGEMPSFQALEAKLRALQDRCRADGRKLHIVATGGNHDINSTEGRDFLHTDPSVEDWRAAKPAVPIRPADFARVFLREDMLGTGNYTLYSESAGYIACLEKVRQSLPGQEYATGALSYAVRIPMQAAEIQTYLTILVLDTVLYSADVTQSGENSSEIRGYISKELMEWALEMVDNAHRQGDLVVAMGHHSFIPHIKTQERSFGGVLSNWETGYPDSEVMPAQLLAMAGVRYAFTGHMHINDIARLETPDGNVLYDIETGSAIDVPSPMRTVLLTNEPLPEGGYCRQMAVDTATIPNVILRDPQTGEGTAIPSLDTYKESRFFTSHRVASFMEYQMRFGKRIANIQKVGLKGFIVNKTGKEAGEFVAESLPEWVGDSRHTAKRFAGGLLSVYFDGIGQRLVIRVLGIRSYIFARDIRALLNNIVDQIDRKYVRDMEFMIARSNEFARQVINTPLRIRDEEVTLGEFANYAFLRMAIGNENFEYHKPENQWVKEAVKALKEGELFRWMMAELVPLIEKYMKEISDTIVYKPAIGEILHTDHPVKVFGWIIKWALGENLGRIISRLKLDKLVARKIAELNAYVSSANLGEMVQNMIYEDYEYAFANDSRIVDTATVL